MAQARVRLAGVSTTNLRRLADLVRGKPVDEAVNTLTFIPSPAAVLVRKTIQSAAANAANNDLRDSTKLKVTAISAGEGPAVRRFRPKARGRVGAFDRPTSHMTVTVDEA
jgi:large subunit ribosomal protein L22